MGEFFLLKTIEYHLKAECEKQKLTPCVIKRQFNAEVKNINDITFHILEIRDSSLISDNNNYTMIYYWSLDCADGKCNHVNSKHHAIMSSHCNLKDCYSLLMKKLHLVFTCQKCREVTICTTNIEHLVTDEKFCFDCCAHTDAYTSNIPISLQKKNLFDCYVCGEEKINIKFKANLECQGSDKHTDHLCKFCWIKNNKKCPLCKE